MTTTTRRHSSACDGRAYSAHAEAEDGQISKDRWEVLLFAKPFRNLVPECGPRDPGSNGGLLNWMPQAAARMQANLDTQSLVLDSELYTRTLGVAQGGIKSVTCPRENQSDGGASHSPVGVVEPGKKREFVPFLRDSVVFIRYPALEVLHPSRPKPGLPGPRRCAI